MISYERETLWKRLRFWGVVAEESVVLSLWSVGSLRGGSWEG